MLFLTSYTRKTGARGEIRTHNPPVKSREQSPVVLRAQTWCTWMDSNHRIPLIGRASWPLDDTCKTLIPRKARSGFRLRAQTPAKRLNLVRRRGIEPRSLGCRPSVMSRSTIGAKLRGEECFRHSLARSHPLRDSRCCHRKLCSSNFGPSARTRTSDHSLMRRALWPLSYRRTNWRTGLELNQLCLAAAA